MLVSRNIFHVVSALQSFAFTCTYTHFILADQISSRSYVGSVYRMGSLAVSYSFISKDYLSLNFHITHALFSTLRMDIT